MGKDDRIQLLESIFANVNSWLTYAEAKNGALLGLNIAVICAIFALEGPIQLWNATLIVILLVATVISMFSFCPNLKSANDQQAANNRAQSSNGARAENLLFYGDIAKIESPGKYLKKLFDIYYDNLDIGQASQIEKDYVEEIWINSRITVRKYHNFRLALMLDLLACAISLIFLIVA